MHSVIIRSIRFAQAASATAESAPHGASGNALRKLIRSFAVAGFWSDEANGEKHDLASNR